MPQPLERLAEALHDHDTVERELGAGGMATVYRADDPRHHRKVALKVRAIASAAATRSSSASDSGEIVALPVSNVM